MPASILDRLQSVDVTGKLQKLESVRYLGGISTVLGGIVEYLLMPDKTRKTWSADYHIAMKYVVPVFGGPGLSERGDG